MAGSKLNTETWTVAIIGSGIIGRNWSMVFSSGGCDVRLFDTDPNQIRSALSDIKETLNKYEKDGSLRGTLKAEAQFNRIRSFSSMKECVENANFVLECVPERLNIKKSVFKEVDHYVHDDVIMASSSSSTFASVLSEDLVHKDRVIVTHPLNPPYFVPFVELVPAPWTAPEVTSRTKAFLSALGQVPVVLQKEVEGFLICRIQHAITAECFKLVRDGVVTADDIDKLMPYGLGRRYAFLGALETSYLNANGMKDFCERYGHCLYKLQEEFGPPIKLEGAPLESIQCDIEKRIPLHRLQERRNWRDRRLAALARFLKDLDADDESDT